VSRESKPKNNRNRLSFGSNREKKLMVLRTPELFRDFFGLFRENSVCFGCFDTSLKQLNKLKQTKKMIFGFAKQTKKQLKQIEFRLVSVRIKKKI
jgi:hypothetical protein